MDLEQTFTDVAEVKSYSRDYVVYIHSYRRGDIIYSFVSEEEDDNTFEFYYVTGAEDESA